MMESIRDLFARLEAWWDSQCPLALARQSLKMNGPQRVLKHPAALTLPAVKERSMAENQPIGAHAAPQPSPVEYREIPGFPGYRVGSDGTLWSCLGRKGKGTGNGNCVVLTSQWRKMSGGKDRDGYLRATMCSDGKRKTYRINRLVLDAFVGRNESMVAAHQNGDRTDNRLSNLKWEEQVENIADKKRHGTHQEGERHGLCRLTAEKVLAIRARRSSGEGLAAIAADFGIAASTVRAIATRRLWRSVP